MAHRVTNTQRRALETALAAGMGAIYLGRARRAALALGAPPPATLSAAAKRRIRAQARQHATLVQRGITERLAQAEMTDPEAELADPGAQSQQAAQEIRQYNAAVLIPFLASWAGHQGMLDTYRATPEPAGSGQSALEATQWVWSQLTDFDDECAEAADASPASYAELTGITGSDPPVHRYCLCSLDPVE